MDDIIMIICSMSNSYKLYITSNVFRKKIKIDITRNIQTMFHYNDISLRYVDFNNIDIHEVLIASSSRITAFKHLYEKYLQPLNVDIIPICSPDVLEYILEIEHVSDSDILRRLCYLGDSDQIDSFISFSNCDLYFGVIGAVEGGQIDVFKKLITKGILGVEYRSLYKKTNNIKMLKYLKDNYDI